MACVSVMEILDVDLTAEALDGMTNF